MKKLFALLALLMLSGCADMSGNAWIDSHEASIVSQILGTVFLVGLGWFVAVKSSRGD